MTFARRTAKRSVVMTTSETRAKPVVDEAGEKKALLREAAQAVFDLRFIQANSVTCLGLTGKAYLDVQAYMLRLKSLQERLEKEAL